MPSKIISCKGAGARPVFLCNAASEPAAVPNVPNDTNGSISFAAFNPNDLAKSAPDVLPLKISAAPAAPATNVPTSAEA